MNSENFDYLLILLIVIFCFGMTASLFFAAVPDGNRDVIMTIVGAIVSKFVTIVDFRFGSSKGSQEKSKIINENIKSK